MNFNLDSRKDCERLAAFINALQAQGVRFQCVRAEDGSAVGYSPIVTITFEP